MSKWLDAAWLKEQLEQAERAYKAGNKSRILHGVVLCTAFGLDRRQWPQWLDRAFNDAYEAGISGAIASWDEVFGRPIPKGKRRKAYQLQRQLTLAIVHRVEQLHATRGKGGRKPQSTKDCSRPSETSSALEQQRPAKFIIARAAVCSAIFSAAKIPRSLKSLRDYIPSASAYAIACGSMPRNAKVYAPWMHSPK
jgi:hypothetical protein